MPPRRAQPLTQDAIDRLIKQRVDAAIATKKERVRNERPTGGPAQGPAAAPPARECLFTGFMKYNPISFHRSEEAALTWWNSQVAIDSKDEKELWNLKVKDYDITAYTNRFNELVLLCPEMVLIEKKKIGKYIRGLSNNIKREVTLSLPTTLNAAVRMTHTLMEQKCLTKAERDAEGKKRKWENFESGAITITTTTTTTETIAIRTTTKATTHQNQQRNQRQGNARAMTTVQNKQADQIGTAPKCNLCGLCHFGNYPVKCGNCGKLGHKTKECRGKFVATGANTQPIINYYECGERGHTRNVCPKRNNRQDKSFVNTSFVSLEKSNKNVNGLQISTSYQLMSGNVAGARETVGSSMVQKYRIQCYNCKEYGYVARECQKPKRAKDAAYHREKMLLCKKEEAGIQLNAEQADWKDDTDDESDNQELEAHYMYMAKIQE
nr:hypothetical protein [Tanacetum cinerariifolium]